MKRRDLLHIFGAGLAVAACPSVAAVPALPNGLTLEKLRRAKAMLEAMPPFLGWVAIEIDGVRRWIPVYL